MCLRNFRSENKVKDEHKEAYCDRIVYCECGFFPTSCFSGNLLRCSYWQ